MPKREVTYDLRNGALKYFWERWDSIVVKTTPLTDDHRQLGAKMVDFHGWNMPVQYTGVVEEHLCVRNHVGLFDLTHMGELLLTGDTASATLNNLVCNDPTGLAVGEIQYSPLMNAEGGIVDDILIYRVEDGFYLVVNASNVEKDVQWIQQHLQPGTTLTDVSDSTSLIAVQGPNAQPLVETFFGQSLEDMKYYSHRTLEYQGKSVLLSRTGYTGEDGFELYLANALAAAVWRKLLELGKPFGVQPIGLGARDTLRLEVRMPLYGNDIDDTTTPLEAGLSRVVAWDTEFLGRDALFKQKEQGVTRRLAGFVLQERGIARQGHTILDADGQPLGTVTSGSMSPSLQQAVGMGYVAIGAAKPGTDVFIEVRGRQLAAKLHKGRFVQVKK